ncbi:MAG: hypothetical protein Q8N88_04640 [Nanoarchaeota archaeon]|nr:hypothetical protein [Nanoarchaeota archaeon]
MSIKFDTAESAMDAVRVFYNFGNCVSFLGGVRLREEVMQNYKDARRQVRELGANVEGCPEDLEKLVKENLSIVEVMTL